MMKKDVYVNALTEMRYWLTEAEKAYSARDEELEALCDEAAWEVYEKLTNDAWDAYEKNIYDRSAFKVHLYTFDIYMMMKCRIYRKSERLPRHWNERLAVYKTTMKIPFNN